jgi:hypothetical protein
MSYTYGMKGAPAVGGGLGGLPSRADVGEIRQFSVAPSNDWLPCDGSVYLKSAYPALAQKLPDSYYGATKTAYTPISGIILDLHCGENNGESAFSLTTNGNNTVVFYVSGGRVTSSASVLSGLITSPALKYLGAGKWIATIRPGSASAASYISYDNARTWTANTAANRNIYGVCGDDRGNIYIGTNNGTSSYVEKSTNNGVSWTTKTFFASPGVPSQNCICYVGNGVLFFLYNTGSMSVSYDYGETWGIYTLPALLHSSLDAIYSNGNGVILAKQKITGGASNYILVASYDYGATWVSTSFTAWTSAELNVVCSFGSNIWTVVDGGLGAYISTNNAKSFNSVGIRSDLVASKYCATTKDASYFYSVEVSGTGTISYLSTAFSVPSISGTNHYIKAR